MKGRYAMINVKKIMGLIMAVVMSLSFSLPAFADGPSIDTSAEQLSIARSHPDQTVTKTFSASRLSYGDHVCSGSITVTGIYSERDKTCEITDISYQITSCIKNPQYKEIYDGNKATLIISGQDDRTNVVFQANFSMNYSGYIGWD